MYSLPLRLALLRAATLLALAGCTLAQTRTPAPTDDLVPPPPPVPVEAVAPVDPNLPPLPVVPRRAGVRVRAYDGKPERDLAQFDAQHTGETLQREVERAAGQAREAMRQAQKILSGMRFGVEGPETHRLFVLPAEDATGADVARIREELAIMDRILSKAVEPDSGRGRRAKGMRLHFGDFLMGDTRELDALYVHGKGAVFLLGVDYPVMEVPVAKASQESKAKPVDETWEKAKRELRGEDTEAWELAETEEATPYDGERVKRLREDLLEALKQAANLKCVQEGETVTLVVSGRGAKAVKGERRRVTNRNINGVEVKTDVLIATADGAPGEAGVQARTVMTLRAKRADVDAWAAGKLDAEEFGRRVVVTTRREGAVAKP
jgi:hypothetical protein